MNKSLYDLSTRFSYFIIITSIISMIALYIYQGLQLHENIEKNGYSILNALVTDTRHSLQKGERNTFQGVLDKIVTLENVEDVSLYTTNGLLTHTANEVSVGLPFLKVNNQLVNPNRDLYIETNGAYIRDDWSFSRNNMEKHDAIVNSLDEFKDIKSKNCASCHFTLQENLKFDKDRRAHIIENDRSYFYYNIPIERNCISCHTHWKLGESAGYLSVSMDNVKINTQANDKLKYFFIILSVVIISFLTIGYFIKQLNKKLQTAQIELKKQANRDPMTNLYNRRSFYEISKNMLLLAQRNSEDLYLIMLDIDNFKKINDTYGHDVGDKVIIALSKALLQSLRKSDVAARWGGEEFLVLLQKTDKIGALATAEKIRSLVEELSLENLKFTISIGAASFEHKKDTSIDSAIKKADKALYEAKKSGKNRVCFYKEDS